jgi:periplasmic protein CpxP/Spy
MKLIRYSFITALALSLFAAFAPISGSAAETQAPTGGQAPAAGRTRQDPLQTLTKQLTLTQDQQKKLKPVLDEQTKAMKELRGNTSLSRQERTAKTKELNTKTQTAIKKVLTPEQLTKYEELLKKQAAGRQGGQRGQRQGQTPQ